MTYTRPYSKTLSRYALAALAVLIAGCSSTPAPNTGSQLTATSETVASYKTIEQRLTEAFRTEYPDRAELMLPITREILAFNPHRARELLDEMPYDDLPSKLQARMALQQAMIAESDNKSWEVFNWLDREAVIIHDDMKFQSEVYILRAKAYYRFGEYQAALDEWLSGLSILSNPERSNHYDEFWQTLLHIPGDRLQALYPQLLSDEMRGWVALAQIYQPGNSLENQLNNLQGWQSSWPSHPASGYLPEAFNHLHSHAIQQPKHIAILLPLSGALSKAGRAVRDGIIAANYEALRNNENLPELKFYDTDSTDINDLASRAISEGAQLIIGPLNKTNVARLNSDSSTQVPVLALNYIDNNTETEQSMPHKQSMPHNSFYQFGLSAEDEALMAAHRGYLDGHQRALVLTPNNEWGKKVNEVFSRTWIELGGDIAESTEFEPEAEFSRLTGQVLHTSTSQQRANQLNRQLGKKLGFRPRRRQDVDMIFIGATPGQARQLKPALAYQFAGSIPVYATSSAFSGQNNASYDQDMDGIRIPVMPWLLPGVSTRLEQQITRLWSQSRGQYGTLYALGADAYQLYPRLQQLSSLPGTQVQGMTGRLSITPDRKVQRELTWQLFRNGRLIPLPINRDQAAHKNNPNHSNHVLATGLK